MKNVKNNPVTNPIINTLASSTDHWYGTVYQHDNKGKYFEFSVTNHLDPKKKYNWRTVGKCKAGFLTIFERENITPEAISYYFSKDTKNVQVYKEFENGKGLWVNVLCFKGGRFYSIDKSILENLNINTMHNAFPKMVDYNLWDRVGAKNHSHMAYKLNK